MDQARRTAGGPARFELTLGPNGRIRERVESPWRLFGPMVRPGGGVRAAIGPEVATARAGKLYFIGNTTAGLFARDDLESEITLLPESVVEIRSPAASYAFSMPQGRARQHSTFHIGRGARLIYHPEPLIPYAGSRVETTCAFHLDEDAGLDAIEMVVLGRIAYGESATFRKLSSSVSVSVQGELCLRDPLVVVPALHGEDCIKLGWAGRACLGTRYLAGACAGLIDLSQREPIDVPTGRGDEDVIVAMTESAPGLIVIKALGPNPQTVRRALLSDHMSSAR